MMEKALRFKHYLELVPCGSIDDVELFKKKFLDSMGVPASRFREDGASFVFGRSTETSRDEYRFKKFLDRLRNRFMIVFEDILKTQLLLKKIIVESDWEDISKTIRWDFAEDNNVVQWKEAEVLNSQIETLSAVDPFVGKYFTRVWVLKNVMKMSDDVIETLLKNAEEEAKNTSPADTEGSIPPEGISGPSAASHQPEPDEDDSEDTQQTI
jgi:hypothetical protein